jgi:hypothetical protein
MMSPAERRPWESAVARARESLQRQHCACSITTVAAQWHGSVRHLQLRSTGGTVYTVLTINAALINR